MTNQDDATNPNQLLPQLSDLAGALRAAGSAHHEYEQTVLEGTFDEQWPMFYAAFVLGRIGEFTTPSALTTWLQEVPAEGNWPDMAAKHVISKLSE